MQPAFYTQPPKYVSNIWKPDGICLTLPTKGKTDVAGILVGAVSHCTINNM